MGGPIFCTSTMISPLRLAKLERRHGVSLRGNGSISKKEVKKDEGVSCAAADDTATIEKLAAEV